MPNPFDQFDAPIATKTTSPAEFAQAYGPVAQRISEKLGVDPQIILGQLGLETGWGKSIIPGTNNLGNIKDFSGSGVGATDNMTGSRDKYRAYASPEAFADDYASLIQRKFPDAVGAKDPLAFATALKAGGYAEDPRYVDKVVQASRMAGTKQNPVVAAVGRAVEAVVPSAQAAEAKGANPFDQFDAPAQASQPVQQAKSDPRKEAGGVGELVYRGLNMLNPAGAVLNLLGTGDPVRDAKNVAGGAVRGAGSIGATALAPIDMASDAMAGKGLSLESNRQRRADMDAGLANLGVETGSGLYRGGKLGAEIAGTAGAGGLLANGIRAAAPVATAAGNTNMLARLANSVGSAGLAVGPGGSLASNALLRMLGGATAGGVGAGMVDPSAAGTGAAVGAALPPVVRLAGAAGGAAMGAVRGVRDMATQAGQNRIAESVLRSSATNPEAAAANLAQARTLVPGSAPTVGQAAADPGLAQLERTLINNPVTAPGLQARFAEQRAARGAAIDDVAATGPNSGTYYDDINEGRRIFANEDYAAARKAGVDPAMAEEMAPQIASLLERPSIKTAINDARRLAAETGETITDLGSVQGLDWVKKALDNQISKAARGTTSSIGAEDLRALNQTRSDLNATLEQLAPAYREANRNFAAMSRQINSMDVARDLERAYTPSAGNFGLSAKEQGNSYMRALRGAQDSVQRSTGRDQAIGDTMSTRDVSALESVGRDLARKEYAETAGRATGSPTAQNLMSQQFIRQIMEGAGLPAEAAANSTILNTLLRPLQFAGRLAEPRVQNRLLELSLSPAEAAAALRKLPPQQRNVLAGLVGLQAPLRAAPAITAD